MMNFFSVVPVDYTRIVADSAFPAVALAAGIAVAAAALVADIAAVVAVPVAGTAAEAAVEVAVDTSHPVAERIAYRNSSKTAGPDSFVHRTAGTEIPAT
jgi:hypothetical protein